MDDATNATVVLLLVCSNCVCASVDDGGLTVFPCGTCFLMSFQSFFIKLFSFYLFHLFVVYAHMTS